MIDPTMVPVFTGLTFEQLGQTVLILIAKCDALQARLDAMAAQPVQPAKQQSQGAQWICVDERMPINGARVLALGIYPDYPPQGADIYTAVFDDVYEVFELNPSPHADEYDTVQLSAVTHWQPLPQPPLRKGEA